MINLQGVKHPEGYFGKIILEEVEYGKQDADIGNGFNILDFCFVRVVVCSVTGGSILEFC